MKELKRFLKKKTQIGSGQGMLKTLQFYLKKKKIELKYQIGVILSF